MTHPDFARLWSLDPGITFLNHGSFGACPREVLRHQADLRAEMEAEPVRFLSRELDDRLDAARAPLAAFVGADPDDLAFVTNATSGVNAVLRSLTFAAGDELLTTDHAYNACKNALAFVASARPRVVIAPIPSRDPRRGSRRRARALTPARDALLDTLRVRLRSWCRSRLIASSTPSIPARNGGTHRSPFGVPPSSAPRIQRQLSQVDVRAQVLAFLLVRRTHAYCTA